jgi:hypothetical protein
MQIQTWKRLIMIMVLAVLTTVTAHAQFGRQFTATIPFSFYVAGKTLPAGQYQIARSTQNSAEGLVLRGADGRGGVFVMTSGIRSNDIQGQSKLVFRRYGDQFFLGEVWTSGRDTGRELVRSRKERQVAQEIAKHGANPQKVSVLEDKP